MDKIGVMLDDKKHNPTLWKIVDEFEYFYFVQSKNVIKLCFKSDFWQIL